MLFVFFGFVVYEFMLIWWLSYGVLSGHGYEVATVLQVVLVLFCNWMGFFIPKRQCVELFFFFVVEFGFLYGV